MYNYIIPGFFHKIFGRWGELAVGDNFRSPLGTESDGGGGGGPDSCREQSQARGRLGKKIVRRGQKCHPYIKIRANVGVLSIK